jgi:hypothetical protein
MTAFSALSIIPREQAATFTTRNIFGKDSTINLQLFLFCFCFCFALFVVDNCVVFCDVIDGEGIGAAM